MKVSNAEKNKFENLLDTIKVKKTNFDTEYYINETTSNFSETMGTCNLCSN